MLAAYYVAHLVSPNPVKVNPRSGDRHLQNASVWPSIGIADLGCHLDEQIFFHIA